MMKVSNIIISYLIFGVLINLFVSSWVVISDSYNLDETNLKDGKNIGKSLDNLLIVSSISNLTEELYSVTHPADIFDILGGILLIGLSIMLGFISIMTTPIEIMGIITGFYYIPPIISTIFGLIFLITLGFVLLTKKLGSDI